MNIQEMHYHFKSRLNKLDSSFNRNLIIPEVDVYLNDAQLLFIKGITNPEPKNESLPLYNRIFNNRSSHDIRTLIIKQGGAVSQTVAQVAGTDEWISVYPTNYFSFLGGEVLAQQDTCERNLEIIIKRYDERFIRNPYWLSNFGWEEVVGQFEPTGLKLYCKGFTPQKVFYHYIKKPSYIHNATGYNVNGYKMPDGVTTLTGTQNCDLPEETHSSIVDLAVMIVAGIIQSPLYQTEIDKLKISN